MSWRAQLSLQRGTLTLDAAAGGDAQTVALIGPNGSGKTTFLRALAGLEPCEGHVIVDDTTVLSSKEGVEIPPEQRRVAYLPQSAALFTHLSVEENVAFGLAFTGDKPPKSERLKRARAMLDELQCGALAKRRCASLSGGERQRVALARALAVRPKLLLLDEPLSSLDVGVRRSVRQLLKEYLGAAEISALIVTHDVRDVRALAKRVFVLEEGRIVQEDDLAGLRRAPATDFVAEFVDAES